jgi:hypothetical protein
MVETFAISGHGVVMDGHEISEEDARTEARRCLLEEEGLSTQQVDAMELADRTVARAYWASPEIGFCGEAHPQAQLVTVVNCMVP